MKTHFLKPKQKLKFYVFFPIFGIQSFFVGWGPEFLYVPKPLQKLVNRDFLEKLG